MLPKEKGRVGWSIAVFGMLLCVSCAKITPSASPGESSDEVRAAAERSLRSSSVQTGIKKDCDSFAGERSDIATARDKEMTREQVEKTIDSVYQNDPRGRLETYDLVISIYNNPLSPRELYEKAFDSCMEAANAPLP
jgi:hypothetical protein